ncbi:MAG: hypothetical protein AAGE52_12330 [Myxococcota bacterium]
MAERSLLVTSHSAIKLVAHRGVGEGRVEATLVLACGCEVTRTMRADRIQEIEGGGLLVVGKYPCPKRHPVRPPE